MENRTDRAPVSAGGDGYDPVEVLARLEELASGVSLLSMSLASSVNLLPEWRRDDMTEALRSLDAVVWGLRDVMRTIAPEDASEGGSPAAV